MKKSFTMIELVFVIVIIGILSAVAIPSLFATRDDAIISKARSDISSIRSAIINIRNQNVLLGTASYPDALDDATFNVAQEELFDGNTSIGEILDYPVYSKSSNGGWMKTSDNNYTITIQGSAIDFSYDNSNGRFDCDHSIQVCKDLTQ